MNLELELLDKEEPNGGFETGIDNESHDVPSCIDSLLVCEHVFSEWKPFLGWATIQMKTDKVV